MASAIKVSRSRSARRAFNSPPSQQITKPMTMNGRGFAKTITATCFWRLITFTRNGSKYRTNCPTPIWPNLAHANEMCSRFWVWAKAGGRSLKCSRSQSILCGSTSIPRGTRWARLTLGRHWPSVLARASVAFHAPSPHGASFSH